MTAPTQPVQTIQELRTELDSTMRWQTCHPVASKILDRLEVAESENKELKARRHQDVNRIYELENNLRNSVPNDGIGMF